LRQQPVRQGSPVAVGIGGFGASNNFGGTNATFFDTLGRTFKLGCA
jgi:hypothetical protein